MKTLEQILEICCKSFGVTPDEVKSRSRIRTVAAARQAFAYHGYLHTDIPMKEVMSFINNTYCWQMFKLYKNRLETQKWMLPLNDQIEYQIITNRKQRVTAVILVWLKKIF